MHDFSSDFIHEVQVKKTGKVTDYSSHPPKITRTEYIENIRAFMDTPMTNEALLYHQRNISLSLFMYLPYGIQIGKEDIIIFEGREYEPSGALEDQGGQHEVNRLPLKLRGDAS